eukprot:26901_1
MDVLQIELLVECWFLNNIQEEFFDEVKSKFKQADEEAWHLGQESEYLMRYIDKLRIHSHIVSRYQLSMDIVQLIVSGPEQNAATNNIYEDAMNIQYCIESLGSNIADGPTCYWKIDAHYFNKIDNYLSVLVCAPIIRQMYQKCVPDLLCEEPIQDTHQQDEILDASPTSALGRAHSTAIASNSNAFHAIQAQFTQSRKYDRDVLDKCMDKCCDNACCDDYTECIHNLDRIYLKTMCLILTAMVLGCLFIILYYSYHGEVQANDAMFLSLEAIGDRLTDIMSNEFWMPQMVASLAIGGLTTGDLLPNASLYHKFDPFFASFTTLSHAEAVFSVFLYHNDLNTMIGAYRSNGSTVIIDYNGTCRQDRLYDDTLRMRIDRPDYLNCEYDAKSRDWYKKAQQIGVGHSQWTEPYEFDELHQGMSYVVPVIWKGINLTFVAEVTTYTLSVAVSNEVQHLPEGSLWMIVTPGLNAVVSSVNETCIGTCNSHEHMIRDGIEWMKHETVSGEQHVSAYRIDNNHDISLYSFPMNHINLHPKPPYVDSSEYMVKPLRLNNASDYQYAYAVILNDESYITDVRRASLICWIITCLSIGGVLVLIGCNIRYNLIEQRELGRQGRSGIIRRSSTKRLRVATRQISSFHHQFSKSGSLLSVGTSRDSLTLLPLDGAASVDQTATSRMAMPMNGDRIKTKDNKYGTVKLKGTLSVLVELEPNKNTVLVPLTHVIMNFGSKAHVETSLDTAEPIRTNPMNRAMIDSKILNASMGKLRTAGEEEEEDTEEDTLLAGQPLQQHPLSQPTQITPSLTLPVIEDEEDEDRVCCDCVTQTQMETMDAKTKKCCYFPQKTLLYITYICLCVTLILLVFIWEVWTTDATSTLFDVMAKHEWNHVQDLAYHLFDSTETIAEVMADRFYRNDMDLTNSHETDRFFVNLMQSFVDSHSNYMQWYIYIATPNGNFRGARWNTTHDVSTLSAGIRDHTTNHSYNVYLINDTDGYHMRDTLTGTLNAMYDSRCRDWYHDTIYYAFEGTLDQAFPNDAYTQWKDDVTAVTYNITNCVEQRANYESMWNLTTNNTWKYDGEPHKMVWHRYLFLTVPQLGLSGSMPIVDPKTGELLAVVAIDYTLSIVGDYIAQTVSNPYDDGRSQISYDNWRSWVFESNAAPQMIASSDGNVL